MTNSSLLSESTAEGEVNRVDSPQREVMKVGSFQGLGSKYSHNEDSLFVFHSNLETNQVENHFGIFIIADGMGGHASGEVASSLALRLMVEKVFEGLYLPTMLPENFSNMSPILEVLESAVIDINRTILQKVPGGGTTLTAVVTYGDSFFITQVGDSRAYLIDEDGEVEQLTEDQTLVQRLITMGQFTKEEARNYPQRNVLYNAIGRSESIEPIVYSRRRPSNCSLLLCSDGLWDVVEDDMISGIILKAATPGKACEDLVKQALSNGGQDNISAILVQFHLI